MDAHLFAIVCALLRGVQMRVPGMLTGLGLSQEEMAHDVFKQP